MTTEITLDKYDPQTKQYVAKLTVTEGEKVYQYTCEGTYAEADAKMIAGALYDQHKARLSKEAPIEAEKAAAVAAIKGEVDKMVTATKEG